MTMNKRKMHFFYLLSDFAYNFSVICLKTTFLENYNALVWLLSTKRIDKVLKIYMLSLSDILFSPKYHCYGTWQKCYGIDL